MTGHFGWGTVVPPCHGRSHVSLISGSTGGGFCSRAWLVDGHKSFDWVGVCHVVVICARDTNQL